MNTVRNLCYLCIPAILYATFAVAFPNQRIPPASNGNSRRTGTLRDISWQGTPVALRDIVYYVQRDGKVVASTPPPANVVPAMGKRPLFHSVDHNAFRGILNNSKSRSNVKIVHTNALTQHIPKGVHVGEITPEMGRFYSHAAYPLNIIQSDSPKDFSRAVARRSKKKCIDEDFEDILTKAGAAQFPDEPGTILMELDMRLTHAQYRYYYQNKGLQMRQAKSGRRFRRKALSSKFTYWPNAVIPYTEDNSFSPTEKALLHESMQEWMDQTCIQFRPAHATDMDVLSVQNGNGCTSFVGRIGGNQRLKLQADCREKHIMTHELGHVIGLIHEHQRPDRDSYITISANNVGKGRMKNYKKFTPTRIQTYGVEYDYTSIMHYGKTAFSKDGVSTTMITNDPNFQDVIGAGHRVSFKDAKVVNSMYGCSDRCRNPPKCGTGYLNKNCQCVCQDGTQNCVYNLWPDTKLHRTMGSRTNTGFSRSLVPQSNLRPNTYPSMNTMRSGSPLSSLRTSSIYHRPLGSRSARSRAVTRTTTRGWRAALGCCGRGVSLLPRQTRPYSRTRQFIHRPSRLQRRHFGGRRRVEQRDYTRINARAPYMDVQLKF